MIAIPLKPEEIALNVNSFLGLALSATIWLAEPQLELKT
jgi:hypothetical protein